MRTYKISSTELSVSRIGYGCAMLAAWNKDPLSADEINRATRIIHTAHEHGISLFDHADIYAFGKSEALFGEVLRRSPGLRDRIVIQSKCGQNLPEGWQFGQPILVNLSHDYIVNAVEGSLKRLGTDRLDILLLHATDALMEPDEIAQAFEDLNRAGKVLHFGVSNFNATQIQLLKKSVRQPIVVNQIRVGLSYLAPVTDGMDFTMQLARGGADDETPRSSANPGTMDYCRLNDIQVQAWSPLRGLLKPAEDAPPAAKRTTEILQQIAREKEAAPSAVALAWLLRHPAGIAPIIGASDARHITENCSADRLALSRDEWYRLFAVASGAP